MRIRLLRCAPDAQVTSGTPTPDAPFSETLLADGAELVIGRLRTLDLCIRCRNGIGGQRSYSLGARGAEAELRHTGHIGFAYLAGIAVDGRARHSARATPPCELAIHDYKNQWVATFALDPG